MISIDIQTLLTYKNNEDALAAVLTENDIKFLVSELASKNDESRYIAFKTLQKRSDLHDDVYPFFNDFIAKLYDDNSYQRSIGIMLIAKNIKWDKHSLFNTVYNDYLKLFSDEKFITSRQTIQSIAYWISCRPDLADKTAKCLMSIDIKSYKNTQSPLICYDIMNSLVDIYKICPLDDIKLYFNIKLDDGILSKENQKRLIQIISAL